MADPVSTLQRGIEGHLIGGGTSKGFFADPAAFPIDETERDELVIELYRISGPVTGRRNRRFAHLHKQTDAR